MLSRTAENLYWIGRYMERAETVARLMEVGSRISLLPSSQGYRSDWQSLLQAIGSYDAFAKKYGDPVQRNIESHLFFDRDNPSSICSCIYMARENARIVRTALTSQVWDAINSAFQEMRDLERTPRSELDLSRLTEWTMRHSAQLRGSIEGTQLRSDGYDFLNIGYFLERADSTARLLDVKYYVLLPRIDFVGSGLDNYQWMTLLRAMSSHRAFHWAYGGEITAEKIAHFLILNPNCPRSLLACANELLFHMDRLGRQYDRASSARTEARSVLARLVETSTDDIFEEGLHEFLTGFISQIASLSGRIHESYLSGDLT
jgi:uncharacterized alpha-E superfamily protein